MSRFFAVAAACVMMWWSGCALVTDLRQPDQLRTRAEALRTRAAGNRKEAGDYEALLRRSQNELDRYDIRLNAYRQRREELTERLGELSAKRAELRPEQADRLRPTIRNYQSQRKVIQAKLDEQRIRKRRVRAQIKQQRHLKNAYLHRARQAEAEAQRLEKYAQRREGEEA